MKVQYKRYDKDSCATRDQAPEFGDPKDMLAEYERDKTATEQGLEGNPASWVSNESLWNKAKRASQHAFGEIRYPFVTWWYLKEGGGTK